MDFGPRGSRIVGLGHAQPVRVVTNDEIAKLVDTSDEWIRTRTGIRTRHIISGEESVVSMAVDAARMAIADGGIDASTIDLVVVATSTDRVHSPNVAGRVSIALGLESPAVMDVNTACSGFEYALGIADQAIRASSSQTALVIGSYAFTTVTDWTDRSTCVLTGDGAGAMVLTASEKAKVSTSVWGSVPELVEAVFIGGAPMTFSQDGRAIFRWAISEAETYARRIADRSGVALGDIDVFAFHQANLRIIDPLAKALEASASQIVLRDVVHSGNTMAASVPLALSKAWHRGELPGGGTALLYGFGGGFTWAGQVVVLPERTAL